MGLIDRDAGIVDEDVDAALLIQHFSDDTSAIIGRADVAGMQRDRRAGAECLGEVGTESLGSFFVPAVSGRHGGSL